MSSEQSLLDTENSSDTSSDSVRLDIEIHSAGMIDTSHSNTSDTVDYEVPNRVEINGDIIEINDNTQGNNDVQNNQDDDDVILIPQNIETIDLCTQAVILPRFEHNEVIDITESPVTAPRVRRTARNVRNARENIAPYESGRSNNSSSPKTSTPVSKPPTVPFDDTFNASQMQRIAISCPICFDSVVSKNPVSTKCGHIFCKSCLNAALASNRTCPMCKKKVLKNDFHDIFL
jgi:Ring finger domain